MKHRLAGLPAHAKLAVTFFLTLIGGGYLAATALIILNIGNGKPPTNDDIQQHYGGLKVTKDPPKPGEPPPRAKSSLELKIFPGEVKDGRTVRKAGTMWQYLTRTKNDETRKKDDAGLAEDTQRAAGMERIFIAWSDALSEEKAGRRTVPATLPEAPEPARSTRALLPIKKDDPKVYDEKLAAILADAKRLTAQQYYNSYIAVILEKHCVRCHGGGDPSGHEETKLDAFAAAAVHSTVDLPPVEKPDANAPTGPYEVIEGGMTPGKLALHIHIHAVTMALMAASAGVFFYFTGFSDRVKLWVMPAIFLAALGDVLSWIGMKVISANNPAIPFAMMTQVSGGLFGMLLAGQILGVFWSMWCCPEPPDEPAR